MLNVGFRNGNVSVHLSFFSSFKVLMHFDRISVIMQDVSNLKSIASNSSIVEISIETRFKLVPTDRKTEEAASHNVTVWRD